LLLSAVLGEKLSQSSVNGLPRKRFRSLGKTLGVALLEQLICIVRQTQTQVANALQLVR
jgi:hypothetical protein